MSTTGLSAREVHIRALETSAGILDADYDIIVPSLVDSVSEKDAYRIQKDMLAIALRLAERARKLRRHRLDSK